MFDRQEKKEISSSILEALPHWFGIQASRQEYINEAAICPFSQQWMNPIHWVLFQ